MSNSPFSLMIAGDVLISRPWLEWHEPAFQSLVEAVGRCDVALANLEAVIHTYQGYAQADSGGAYTAAPPQAADDLARFGFGMVSTANNHSYDFGTHGVLETLEHLDGAGIKAAGTGKDLQQAQSPAVLTVGEHRVALIAMTATFYGYNRASPSLAEFRGRPGINPLTLTSEPVITCPKNVYRSIRARRGARARLDRMAVKWRGITWEPGERYGFEAGRRIAKTDSRRIIETVSEADQAADLTIVSIHSHNERPWLQRWCKTLIDNGADIVFVHGNHRVGGIEVYQGKPILYGLGDFVFQPHLIDRIPAEAFVRVGLPIDASLEEYREKARKSGPSSTRAAFEGALAQLQVTDGRLTSLSVIPVDLQFDAAPSMRGSPRRAQGETARRIIGQISKASRRYGSSLRYDSEGMCGEVELGKM